MKPRRVELELGCQRLGCAAKGNKWLSARSRTHTRAALAPLELRLGDTRTRKSRLSSAQVTRTHEGSRKPHLTRLQVIPSRQQGLANCSINPRAIHTETYLQIDACLVASI